MVTFSAALAQVKQHVEQCLPEEQICQSCRDIGYRWRDRKLGPVISVHLIVLQLLAKVSLRGLRHVAGLCVSAQAVCLAKNRLPVQLFLKLIQHSIPAGLSGKGSTGSSGCTLPTAWVYDRRHSRTGPALRQIQEPERTRPRAAVPHDSPVSGNCWRRAPNPIIQRPQGNRVERKLPCVRSNRSSLAFCSTARSW